MASNEQPTSSGTQRTVHVKVQRRGKSAAPVSLDLRTPSGRRLPF
jgi:hypothetical protein